MRKLLSMLMASVFSLTAFAGADYLGVIQGRYATEVEDYCGIDDVPGNVTITATGLPAGLKVYSEYESWNDETDVDVEGFVTAAPGTYDVTFYKNGKAFKTSKIKVYAMPKITGGKYTASSSNLTIGRALLDEDGDELEEAVEKTEKAKVNVTIEMKDSKLTKCDYTTESKFWKDSLTLADPRQQDDFEVWVYCKVDGKEGVVCSLWLEGYPNDGSPYDYFENYVTFFFANSGEVTCFTGYCKERTDGGYSYYILEKNDYPEFGVPLKMTKVTTPGSGTTPSVVLYTITFNANGGTGGKTVTQATGTTLTAPTVTREGYTFTGWSPAVPAKTPAVNVTYTAQWKKNTENPDIGGGDNPRPEESLDVTYKRSGKKVIVTGKKSDFKGEALTIPAMIEGCPVTEIGDDAFEDCRSLTSVTIPSSVTSIGYCAFYGCSSLTSVTIPSSVTSIGYCAFRDCSSLTSVTIPEGVTSIGIYTFSGCSSLTSVTIPDSVTSIGSEAFSGCSSLTSVTIPDSVTSISSEVFIWCSSLTSVTFEGVPPRVGSVVFDGVASGCKGYYPSTKAAEWEAVIVNGTWNGLKMVKAEDDSEEEDPILSLLTYTISNGEVTITGCDTSASGELKIPATIDGYPVTSIGDCAFWDCSRLTSVMISEGVTSIGDCAFWNCSSLTSVTIPSSVTSIGECAFYNCDGLTSIIIPSSVTTIDHHAFDNCSNLASVILSNQLKVIERGVFEDCGLTSIIIPGSVDTIEVDAFYYCNKLKSVTIEEGVTSIKMCAFDGCSKLPSIVLPNTLTSIGVAAFADCHGLTSITIPANVSTIEGAAFVRCKGLTAVTFEGVPPEVIPYFKEELGYFPSPFVDLNSACTIYYPSTYASQWEAEIVDGKWMGLPMKPYDIGEGEIDLKLVTFDVNKKGQATITGCSKAISGWLDIPEILNGATVVAIANGAFKGQRNLEKVTLPDTITSIGKDAFKDCSNLDVNAIVMPNQAKLKVDKGAFTGCKVTEVNAVPGEPLTSKQLGKAAGYKAATTASGLKLNAKTGDLTATFKKSGTYEAVLFKPGANLKAVRIKVGDMPKLTIKMEGANTGCSVKGAGEYLMGKKVSLSAKASKEKIFLGFYDAQGKQLTSAMKYSYVMGRENVTLTAKFKEEVITIDTSALTSKTWKVGETVNVTIPVKAESGVKSVKAAKLPSGLKLAKTKDGEWQVTGSPKKEGNYTVTFTVGTVQKKQKTVSITMKVLAESVTINTAAVQNKTLNVGQAASGLTIGASATSGIKSVKASKLPAGMKVQLVNGNWQLTGAPKKAGTYTVTLTITTTANTKATETFTLTVALVPEWAIGTYSCDSLENGWWCEDCEQMEYAYGDGWIAIDEVGNVRGKINLCDDSSYTYADIDTKANVKIRDDGACAVTFNINVYTLEDDGELENEGRFSFEVIVKEAGTLVLDYGDPSEYVQGIFRK